MSRDAELRNALLEIENGRAAHELESTTLDFKVQGRSVEDTLKELAQAACCFSNSSGGAIVVGVTDKAAGPAAFVGTTLDPHQVSKRIYELSKPALVVDAQVLEVQGARLLAIFAPQSPELHSDPQGRAPRRIGTDCVPMSPSEQMRAREDRLGIDGTAQELDLSLAAVSKLALEAARKRLRTFPDARRKLATLTDRDLLSALGVLGPKGRLLRAGQRPWPTPASTGTFI